MLYYVYNIKFIKLGRRWKMDQQLLFKERYESYEDDFDVNDWYQLELFDLEYQIEISLKIQD